MTRLMEQAINRLRSIPETEQDRVAQFVLNEIEEDMRWINSTDNNQSKLKGLIENVLADDSKGQSIPLNPDQL